MAVVADQSAVWPMLRTARCAGSMRGTYTFLRLSSKTLLTAEIAPFALVPDRGSLQPRSPPASSLGGTEQVPRV